MTTTLGDLVVSPLGFGCMALSHVYGAELDDHRAREVLFGALDAGVTFWDTANVYGASRPGSSGPAGTNEQLVGSALQGRRGEVQLATKFGITGDPAAGAATRGDAKYVRTCCEESLRRLGTDVIDLYYLHRRDPNIPVEETVEAMAELVAAGKVRHLGLSEVTADELRAAHAVHPIAAVQSEWSIWSRDVEARVVPTAAELGVGLVPYSPLGRGFLTGTLTREAIRGGMLAGKDRFDKNFEANQAVVDVVRGVADELAATPAQVALAWLLEQGRTSGLSVVPIPGTSRVERVRENLGAVELTLTGEHLERLNAAADLVQGGRNINADPRWISSGRE